MNLCNMTTISLCKPFHPTMTPTPTWTHTGTGVPHAPNTRVLVAAPAPAGDPVAVTFCFAFPFFSLSLSLSFFLSFTMVEILGRAYFTLSMPVPYEGHSALGLCKVFKLKESGACGASSSIQIRQIHSKNALFDQRLNTSILPEHPPAVSLARNANSTPSQVQAL